MVDVVVVVVVMGVLVVVGVLVAVVAVVVVVEVVVLVGVLSETVECWIRTPIPHMLYTFQVAPRAR